jgi:uncharacterized protein (TIGR02466 family)
MITTEYYFPTIIFSEEIDTRIVDNDTIRDLIYAQRENDPDGLARSNFKGLGGWHSKNDLHLLEDFHPVTDAVHSLANHITEKLGYEPSKRLRIESMWAIINPPGSLNKSHIHPHSLWSGVYYVQTPGECGNIEFTDPRTEHVMNEPAYRTDQQRPKPCWNKVRYAPSPRKLLLFPSWLYHSTQPNMSEAEGRIGDRIIISFNLSQV